MTAAQGSVVLFIIVMICYITEVVPIAVTAISSCILLAVFNIAPPSVVWVGFSSDTTLVVGGMVVVGTAIIETGAAKTMGRYFSSKANGNYWIAAFSVMVVAMVLSGFMNNSAAVATMLPVVGGVVLASNGALHEKHWFLPLAVATNAGGMMTLIGTTSQMVIQNFLQENGLPLFGFFEFAWVGLPVCIAFIAYFLLFNKKLSNRIWGFPQEHTEMVQNLSASLGKEAQQSDGDERGNSGKQILVIVIMLIAIVWMVSPLPTSNGTVAMAAAVATVITKCISLKELYKKFDWSTMFVLVGGIGFANGLDKSGGGNIIANAISRVFGESMTPMQLFVMFVISGAVLTLFMSNTAVAAMLAPIAVAFGSILDFNLAPVLMGICMATNCAFSTPIATPSMTLVLGPGEYRFNDYLRWCLPFNAIAVVMIIVIVPLVWPLI